MLEDSDFGRYELVDRLAVRATSELFVVRVIGEHGFRRDIVLKRLRDDTHAAGFIEDAKLSARLSHAKIVQTLELGSLGEVPYVAMEYVDGIDLLGMLQELARTHRALDPALAAWIAHEILDALDYAHTVSEDGAPLPIVHGHLSPSKVLLGDRGEVKLCDFGVARRFDLAHSGGQDYGHLAPEQVMELPVDPRSDVFGVGVLLAEMLMQKRLFAAHNEFDVLLMVRDVRVQRLELGAIDEELVAIVRRALERRPEDRWPTAAAFRDALDAWLFAHRRLGMNQQLAALVGELRDEVEAWRRTGDGLTAAFDAIPDLTPVRGWGTVPPGLRTVAIPPRDPAKSTEARTAARGTVDPATIQAIAAGTERPAVVRTDEPAPPPAAKPESHAPVPKPVVEYDSQRIAHPHLVARAAPKAAIGMGLADLLPARTPAEARRPAQLLTAEQLAKAGQPPPPRLAQLERAPDDGGDFVRTPPLRVLFHLMRARATGMLSVTLDSIRKDVYVRDGQLAGVWSNDAGDLFGNYLVAQRVLSDGELAMALATMSYYGGKIGDTLVGLGLLERMEVFRHLTRHARMKVVDLCTWKAGRYAWYAGKEDSRESFPLEAEAFSMLGEAALALPADTIEAWLAKHRDARLVTVKSQRVSPDAFKIPRAAELATAATAGHALHAVVASHADPGWAARVLYLFVARDLARLA